MSELDAYRTAARDLIDGLTEAMACVHGPEFDSARWFAEEGDDLRCSICTVVRPFVALLEGR